MSVLMLFTVLFNAQGVFIEHHDCSDCGESTFVEANHTCCNSGCESHQHTEDLASHKEHCDLFDFEDKDHKASCACFAEYIQIPVFYSELKEDIQDNIESVFPNQVFNVSPEILNLVNEVKLDFSPPDVLYQNTSKQLLFCTFLC
jgi:hypothetical protein